MARGPRGPFGEGATLGIGSCKTLGTNLYFIGVGARLYSSYYYREVGKVGRGRLQQALNHGEMGNQVGEH